MTLLENNIVRQAARPGNLCFWCRRHDAGIMLLGFELELGRIMVVATLGACLGILMMLPCAEPSLWSSTES
jgi:uncharacterized oligopeptide transporter (OPT) family protein